MNKSAYKLARLENMQKAQAYRAQFESRVSSEKAPPAAELMYLFSIGFFAYVVVVTMGFN